MRKEFLGEFEELVLTMVGVLQEDSYGAAIVQEIKNRMNRATTASAVHVTLQRLEEKGFLTSELDAAKGARVKRVFMITDEGLAALQSKKTLRMTLWNLIPELKSGS